ncbi:methyltransferase domain-containing protein [Streptacidiphilus sp. ASG 303]|uniref:methyltransferase domain-containing protein n=1 Tax=Streptomycetaceae TaxID=2062 RepID=UPI001E4C155B|nr:methyltransferase domain-containing protein [Streptacidiphilus sp. ASG 303]MCD0481642.1 methyltransferase domain-containing protein [Streptacidiphilus sp. ASG 303]
MYPTRPRSSLRTAVVWEVLSEALDRRAAEQDRPVLDVLDTGGGTGNFAVPVARLGHRVTVVDPSPDALFALERRAAEAGVTDLVRAVQGDTQTLADLVEPGSVDAVLCHGVLEVVDDPADALSGLAAVLRKGGLASLLAANRDGAVLARALAGHFAEARHALEDETGRWGAGDPVPRRFTADELRGLAGGAGLHVLAVHGIRVFADLVPGVLVDSEPGALESLLRLEEAAARQPAFHAVATQLHLLAELA